MRSENENSMRRIFSYIASLLAIASATLQLVSCGIMELEEQEQIVAMEMMLERDSVFIMVGDDFTLQPTFKPDSVTVSDIFWSSEADSVLSVKDGHLVGESEGTVWVYATSVSRQLKDSLVVVVMPRWEDAARLYPNEMIVYADVTIDGKPFDPDKQMLGAFVDDEMRGIGTLQTWKDKSYVRFRIGSDIAYYDPDGITEDVTFRVYYKQELRYDVLPYTLEYDGETHGTLSNLIVIKK